MGELLRADRDAILVSVTGLLVAAALPTRAGAWLWSVARLRP